MDVPCIARDHKEVWGCGLTLHTMALKQFLRYDFTSLVSLKINVTMKHSDESILTFRWGRDEGIKVR
jgi:hypothetical protein